MRVAVQHPGALADQVLELRAAELMVEPGLHHADELADAHLPAAQPILRHQHAGEPGDQGAVEVEEGARPPGPRGLASISATEPGSRRHVVAAALG